MRTQKQNSGFVLTAVMMLLLIASLVGGAFLFSARNSFSTIDQWRIRDECLLATQSGLEQAKYRLDEVIQPRKTMGYAALDVLGTTNVSGNYIWMNQYGIQPVATVAVNVVGAYIPNPSQNTSTLILTNTASCTYGGVTRRVREITQYVCRSAVYSSGSVFDNAYYVDQSATFNGVNGDFNGEVRAFGDIDFSNCHSLILNGDVYAGGTVLNYSSGNYDWYNSLYLNNLRARPLLYTDRNVNNTNTYWPQGYSGTVNRYNGSEPPSMPYVGPLSDYETYALATTGTITKGGATITGVWGDATNENAGIGFKDEGCLILTNGTTIQGVFVARGDVYIKGTVSGKGTIYAGRNIYVIGDLSYSNPPTWTKPDSNPSNTAAINAQKDFIALCAKGNVILGDDFKSFLKDLAKNPITQSQAADASDLSLGYVTSSSNGVSYFNGDYTGTDGQNHDAVRTDGSQRAFYDPMLSDAAFQALGVSASISKVDGVIYANHMLAGTTANGMQVNGSMVCRDEVLKREGNLYFNWDIRLGSRSREFLGFGSGLPSTLPRNLSIYRTLKWTELSPP